MNIPYVCLRNGQTVEERVRERAHSPQKPPSEVLEGAVIPLGNVDQGDKSGVWLKNSVNPSSQHDRGIIKRCDN